MLPADEPFALVIQEPESEKRIVEVSFVPCSVGTGPDVDVQIRAAQPVRLQIERDGKKYRLLKFDGADASGVARSLRLENGININVGGVRLRFLSRLPKEVRPDARGARIEVLSAPRVETPDPADLLAAQPTPPPAPTDADDDAPALYVPQPLDLPPRRRPTAPPSRSRAVDPAAWLARLETLRERLEASPPFLAEAAVSTVTEADLID